MGQRTLWPPGADHRKSCPEIAPLNATISGVTQVLQGVRHPTITAGDVVTSELEDREWVQTLRRPHTDGPLLWMPRLRCGHRPTPFPVQKEIEHARVNRGHDDIVAHRRYNTGNCRGARGTLPAGNAAAANRRASNCDHRTS